MNFNVKYYDQSISQKNLQVIDEHTLKLEQAAVTVAPVFKQMQATPNAGSKANGSSDQNIDMDNVNLNDSASPQKTTDVTDNRIDLKTSVPGMYY